MNTPDHRRRKRVGTLILALVVGALVAVAAVALVSVLDSDGPASSRTSNAHKRATVTTRVDSADKGAKPDVTITVPRSAVKAAARGLATHQGERDETPNGVDTTKAQDQQEELGRRDAVPPNAGLGASDSVPGCVTGFVVNQSARTVAPRLFVLHETVSPNVAGWADVNAVAALFNRSSAQASSHFVIDHEGHCRYIVPLARKAWTQAAANPVSVSVEFIDTATARDGSYCGGPSSPGCAKLASVFWHVHARYPAIRPAVGNGSGCVVRSTGIVDHRSLGPCAGGHVDITPWDYRTVAAFIASHKPGAAPLKPGQCHAGAAYVRRIQAALNARGARLVVDGDAGPKTRAAIAAFQRAHNLAPASGFAGPKTRRALGVPC